MLAPRSRTGTLFFRSYLCGSPEAVHLKKSGSSMTEIKGRPAGSIGTYTPYVPKGMGTAHTYTITEGQLKNCWKANGEGP